jgi:hypothetical protein
VFGTKEISLELWIWRYGNEIWKEDIIVNGGFVFNIFNNFELPV